MRRVGLAAAMLGVAGCHSRPPLVECDARVTPADASDEPAAARLAGAALGTWRFTWRTNDLPDRIGASLTVGGPWAFGALPACEHEEPLLEVTGLTASLAGADEAPLAVTAWGARADGELLLWDVRGQITSGPLFDATGDARRGWPDSVEVVLYDDTAAVSAVWPDRREPLAWCGGDCAFERVEP